MSLLHLSVAEGLRNAAGSAAAAVARRLGALPEHVGATFAARCFDSRTGRLIWRREFPNTFVTVGKNLMLSTFFSGSAYSVTGPFMGLITNTGFTAIAAADTMTSHAGWAESSAYGATRPTLTFAAPSGGAIALTAAAAFTMTGGDTLVGVFVVLGTGAVATVANTAGTLASAGAFTGGNATVSSSQVIDVSLSFTI